MVVRFLLAARYAEQNKTGSMYLIGAGIDLIQVGELPHQYPSLFAVGKVSLERGDVQRPHVLRLRLTDPDGESVTDEITNTVPIMDIPENRYFVNANLCSGYFGIIFLREGIYNFELYYDDQLTQSVPIRVERIAAPAGAPEEQAGFQEDQGE
jgi:hypothetical protein